MSRVWDNVRDYGVGTHSLSAETIGTTMHPTRLVGLAELMVVGRGGVHAVLTSGATNHDLEGASVLNAISDPMGRSPICSAYGIKGYKGSLSEGC